MPEHIPQLDQLLEVSKGVPMMPASEVRRRGNRRRTIRNSVVAAGSCALVLAVGFGVTQLPWLRSGGGEAIPATPDPSVSAAESPSAMPSPSETDQPTEDPTTTQPAPLSFDLLPTGEEMGQQGFPYSVLDEHEGIGQAGKDICDPGAWGDPTSTISRAYGTEGYSAFQHATLFQYSSAAEAKVGFDELRGGYALCKERVDGQNGLKDVTYRDYSSELPVDVAAVKADPTKISYGNFGALIEGSQEGHFGQVMIAQLGDRVLWVTEDSIGMDNNCGIAPGDDSDEQQCPIPRSAQSMLEKAASRQ